MKLNNKIKLASKNGKSYMYVEKKQNGRINTSNKGFTRCWNHPMHLDHVNIAFIDEYYNIPTHQEPL